MLIIKIQFEKEKKKFIAKFGTLNSKEHLLQNHKVLIKRYYLILQIFKL